jgi:peptide/nickel transport system permease protein
MRRLLLLIPTFLGVTFAVFMVVRLLPGDIVDQIISDQSQPSPEFRASVEKRLELNKNIPRAYAEWLGNILTGDYGSSFVNDRPVSEQLASRIPVTFQLGIMAMVYAIAIGIPIGILSAVRQDSKVDYLSRSFAIMMLAVPSFWAAEMVIVYGFDWFGWTPPLKYANWWDNPVENIKMTLVPMVILGSFLSGSIMRLTRSTMLEVMRQDYVRTARAKGLNERAVILRHALRNSILPVITVIGLQVSVLISGTVVLERIFTLPGMGRYLLYSLEMRDYPTVQAIVLLAAVLILLTNLVVDLSYAFIDPRIRYS